MYTHVIFDLDGTLLNTIDDLADSMNHVCAAHGWPVHEVEAYKTMVGNGMAKLVSRAIPDGVTREEETLAVEEFVAYYDLHKQDKTVPYRGIADVLKVLKAAGVTMAVLTNKREHAAIEVVEHYFPGIFHLVQGVTPGVRPKPDPTQLYSIMERLGTNRENTLFVGDSNVDIRTGKNGGLTACGVLWGFRTREELIGEGADLLVEHPYQLAEHILGTALLEGSERERAAEILARGGLVALPTETVYGLAADATRAEAVQANYDAKGRPETKPMSVLVDSMTMVEAVCKEIPLDAYKLAEAFWPGPLTMVLKGNGTLPSLVTAQGSTQGVRCPAHEDTLAVIAALGRPLACPSANLSGHPSPKSAGEVLGQLAGRIDAVLEGGNCSVGVESTIVDLTATPYRILRQGGLAAEELERILGKKVSL